MFTYDNFGDNLHVTVASVRFAAAPFVTPEPGRVSAMPQMGPVQAGNAPSSPAAARRKEGRENPKQSIERHGASLAIPGLRDTALLPEAEAARNGRWA